MKRNLTVIYRDNEGQIKTLDAPAKILDNFEINRENSGYVYVRLLTSDIEETVKTGEVILSEQWIPVKDIISISGFQKIVFDNREEKMKYVKAFKKS